MSEDVKIPPGTTPPRHNGGGGQDCDVEDAGDGLELCAQSRAALSHIRAVASGLRRFSTLQGKNSRPQTLETMVADSHQLHDLCSSTGWVVPKMISGALMRLLASFKEDSSRFNASSHRTCAKALDFLRSVISSGKQRRLQEHLPLRVMIIDDDAVSRRAMLMAFNVDSVTVTACCCGEEAIEKLRAADFDIVFSDIMMPRISGLNLLPLIRDLPRHRQTPVVFVTALSDFQTKAKSTATGGCDFVAKPFVPNELLLKAFSFGFSPFLSEAQEEPAANAQSAARLAMANNGGSTPKPEGNGKPAPAQKAAPVHKMLGVVTVGHAGIIASCNKDALDMFAYEASELSVEKIDKLFPPELQSEEGKQIIQVLHGSSATLRVGPSTLVGRAKDGRLQKVSVTLSQSSSRGTLSSVLLISAPENLKTNQKEDSKSMTTQQPALRPNAAAPSELVERAAVPSVPERAEEALREELAASRAISASLEKHQSKLEQELDALRESNKRLQWQLHEAEGLLHSQSANTEGVEASQQAFAAIKDELKSLFQEFRAEFSAMRQQVPAPAPEQRHEPVQQPVVAPVYTPPVQTQTAPSAPPAFAAPVLRAEQTPLLAQLERQQSENRNQQLIQSLLCEYIRKLDPTRA